MLEYVRLMVEIDNLHFTKSKKKGRMTFLVVMGGYAINEKRGIKEALELLKSLDLPLLISRAPCRVLALGSASPSGTFGFSLEV